MSVFEPDPVAAFDAVEPVEPDPFVAPEPVGPVAVDAPPVDLSHDEPVFDVNDGSAVAGQAVAGTAAPRRRSGAESMVVLGLFGAVFGFVLLIVVVVANRAAPSGGEGPGYAVDQPTKPVDPPEIVKFRRAELDELYGSLSDVKRDKTTGPILDEIDRLFGSMRQRWAEHDWTGVDADLTRLEPRLKELERIDREQKETATAKAAAERSRDSVAEARSRAERAGAVELAAALWKEATDEDAAAVERYGAGDYSEAQANWDRSLSAFEEANSLASAGVAARQTREKVIARSVRRFTREQLDASGGEAWEQVTTAIEEGDEAYEQTHYADAISRYEYAGDTIEAAEVNVQRELGVKFYAVNAGYIAASILIEHASGQYLDGTGRRSLLEAYRNVGLNREATSKLPAADGDKLSYRALGNALAIQMRDVIRKERGEAVQKAYNIGFQLRLVQKLLGEDGELKVTDAHKIEVGKSLIVVQREAEAAGFADPLTDEIERIRKILTRGGDSSVGQARQLWLDLIGRLSRYESAIEIVGEAGK